jgi:hypothetical protein
MWYIEKSPDAVNERNEQAVIVFKTAEVLYEFHGVEKKYGIRCAFAFANHRKISIDIHSRAAPRSPQ